jgi:hypothetical protein
MDKSEIGGELGRASIPLRDLIHTKYNPHTVIMVESDRVRVFEGTAGEPVPPFGSSAEVDRHQRLIFERDELQARYDRLGSFFLTPQYPALSSVQQELLAEQSGIMLRYLKVLKARLHAEGLGN